MTSCARSKTAPSTQPPDTLPVTSPAASTAMTAPGCRGALLLTPTTVARANGTPSPYHACRVPRTSRMVRGSDPGGPGHDVGEMLERGEAVPLDEVVNVRQ